MRSIRYWVWRGVGLPGVHCFSMGSGRGAERGELEAVVVGWVVQRCGGGALIHLGYRTGQML